ncbi:MAG: universal stress protein [Syntrophales bacterium]|nr:universal stress protein [Syntrophales bacterium]
MIKTILIPTDGSEHGRTAIDYGIYVAKKLKASLVGIHVLDLRLIQGPIITDVTGPIGLPPCADLFPAIERELEKKADNILKSFEDRCYDSGLSFVTKKVYGIVGETIIEEAKSTDLIVMAKRGEHSHVTIGGIVGSTTEYVVRKAGKPVMVTPKNFIEIESIALAYDGSPPADHALKIAAFLSEKGSWPLTTIIVSNNDSWAYELSSKIERYLEDLNVDNETIVLRGKEEKEIVNFLHEGSVELLIMGAYGHNRLRELLGGSTTSYVIRHSPCAVLLTR